MDRNDYHHDKVGKQTNKQNSQMQKQTSEIHHQTNEKKFVLNKRRIPYDDDDDDLRIQTKIEIRFFKRPILENIISGDIPVMFFVFLVFFVIDFLITGKKIYRLIMMK